MSAEYRNWEYEKRGDYHRNLNLDWSYAPTYLAKLRQVDEFIRTLPATAKILDLACGEGVLVEKYLERGLDIIGLDYNYASDIVVRGDARHTPFHDMHFDAVLFMDALEHFQFADQGKVLSEIYRILKPTGTLFLAVPNLAHLDSRISLLFTGNLERTDNELDHVGERPTRENRKLIEQAGFSILKQSGITFTLPFIYKHVICKYASRTRWLHDALDHVAALLPGLAMLNCFTCKKTYYLEQIVDIEQRIATVGHYLDKSPNGTECNLTEEERLFILDRVVAAGHNPVFLAVTGSSGQNMQFIESLVNGQDGTLYSVNTDLHKTSAGIEASLALVNQSSEIDLLFIDVDDCAEVKQMLSKWFIGMSSACRVFICNYQLDNEIKKMVRDNIFPYQTDSGSITGNLYSAIVNAGDKKTEIQASVIIPAYKHPAYLEDAITSILDQDTSIKYEVLVMDNACSNDLSVKIEQLATVSSIPLRYVAVPDLGLHNCRNKALFVARGELVVYVDDDVIVPNQWLENLLHPFSRQDVAMVAGRVQPRWETSQPDWINVIDPSYFSLLDLGDMEREMQWPEAPYGCNMAVRRRVALQFQGFAPDSVGTATFEWKRGDGETGFASKVYAEQMAIYYMPEAYLYHRIPAQRLTKSFLYKRTVKSAISSFYSDMRTHGYNRKSLLILAGRNLYLGTASALKSLLIIVKNEDALLARLRALNFFCKALYQVRLVMDKKLRAWVRLEHYLFNYGKP